MPYVDWTDFLDAGTGIFPVEAFVTGKAKGDTHVDDAAAAVSTFCRALPDPTMSNSVSEQSVFSLIGAAAVWAGLSDDPGLLGVPCLVLRAAPSLDALAPRGDERDPARPDLWIRAVEHRCGPN